MKASDDYVRHYLDDAASPPWSSSSHSNDEQVERTQWPSNGAVADGVQRQGTAGTVTVGLKFRAELPRQPRTQQAPAGQTYSLRNITCAATVGEIYKSSAISRLRIMDPARSTTRAPIRTRDPFHLQSSNGTFNVNSTAAEL